MNKLWETTDRMARNLRQPINTAAISIMGAYTFLWGLWVALPWTTFLRSPIYDLMANLAPEVVWGIVAIIIGLYILRGVIKSSYKALRAGARAGFYFWFIIAGFFILGSWASTGWISAFMVCVYCAFISINLRINKKTLADLHDNKERNNIKP